MHTMTLQVEGNSSVRPYLTAGDCESWNTETQNGNIAQDIRNRSRGSTVV